MKSNELSRVILGPWRQHNVVQDFSVLFRAKFKLILVREEFWEIEELRDELLDIRHVGLRGR